MKYNVTIGIEIHLELKTNTKMFSPARNTFDEIPNSHVHPIDLGYPGTLPRPNKQAVSHAIKLAKVLNMDIDNLLRFDRKNYFYTDLPKSYQITQQFHPIGKNGFVDIKTNEGDIKRIQIERIHLEEDTAKQIHVDDLTLIDFNRAGVPLIEIVTLPVISSSHEAMEYVDTIRKIAMYLGISDAKMEKGSLRVDINISLNKPGDKTLGTKVEIKNMNSISNIKKAIEYEIEWQTNCLENDIPILQQTKRFDEQTNTTKTMRVKTSAIDYKYFEEPNILPIPLSNEWINSFDIPKMFWDVEKELKEYGVSDIYITQLTNNLDYLNYFNAIGSNSKNTIAKVFFSEIVSLANQKNINVLNLSITPSKFGELINLLDAQSINSKQLKELIKIVDQEPNKTISSLIKEHGFDSSKFSYEQIKEIVDQICLENKNLFDEFKVRPERVFKFIIGNVMKSTKGQADPKIVNQVLNDIFK